MRIYDLFSISISIPTSAINGTLRKLNNFKKILEFIDKDKRKEDS